MKEEVYGALDSFIAWELEFPLITVKKAIKSLEEQKEWKRVIQVIKLVSNFLIHFLSHPNLLKRLNVEFVGDKVDVKQRTRKNNGNVFHSLECFS